MWLAQASENAALFALRRDLWRQKNVSLKPMRRPSRDAFSVLDFGGTTFAVGDALDVGGNA